MEGLEKGAKGRVGAQSDARGAVIAASHRVESEDGGKDVEVDFTTKK